MCKILLSGLPYFESMKRSLILIMLFCGTVYGQSIDFWQHPGFRYRQQAWLNFENDFFVWTDRYYSQGLAVCYKQPLKSESWFNNLFLPLKGGQTMMGFAAEHLAFTPSTIAFDSLLSNDRPFAGTVRLHLLFESIDPQRNSSLSWTLSGGIIGKEALGKELQTGVHRITGNPHPKGWHHQIRTGLLLDAGLFAQQQYMNFGRWFIAVAEESANFGTSRIDATLGTRIQLQLFTPNKRWGIAFYANPAFRFVGYDGTLQGSIIGQRSEYIIARKDVSRVIFEREFGILGTAGNVSAMAVFNMHTKQYDAGMTHRWGGLRLVIYL